MATNTKDNASVNVREVINQLQAPVSDIQTLLALLSGPLDCLGLLPPQFRRYNVQPLPYGAVTVSRHIPLLQRALLEHVAPTWDTAIVEENATPLLEQYLCPDSFSFASSAAGDVALLAYSTIMTIQPLTEYAIRVLARLSVEYPVDRLYPAVFPGGGTTSRRELGWEDCVRNLAMVPGKVANAVGGKGPPALEHGTYFNNFCVRCECLISSLSIKPSKDAISSLSYLLTKFVNLGVFPSSPPVSRSQPSFFQTTLPTIRSRLDRSTDYSDFWTALVQSLPSSLTLQSILTSLFGSLSLVESATDSALARRARIKRESLLLHAILGPLTPGKQELWESVTAIMLARDWSESYARIYVCWVSGACRGQVDEEALSVFIDSVVEIWSSPEHIKHSLLSRHRYITSLLLVAVSYLPSSSHHIQTLAFSPAFIKGIGIYVGHLDQSVRRCGMLVAEVVAQRAGKKLDFGDWDGDDSGKPWAREMRVLIKARDVDSNLDVLEITQAEESQVEEISTVGARQKSINTEPQRAVFADIPTGYDSDDSVTGYASPPSSRSASPTPSELDEIEKDPTLRVGIRKIPRPVYLAQLGELIRGSPGLGPKDEGHEADKIEMALNCAEELIRKKKDYGTELDENAVNLAYALLGLQDSYELEGFEIKRQDALNALVACCPRKAAPSLIEEFFKNQYSTSQRFVVLNALALGARELASLPIPPPSVAGNRIAFPSKVLPEVLHRKYLAAGNQDNGVLPLILDGISRQAIDRGKEASADKVPELVRERRLRVRKPQKVTEVYQPPKFPSRLQQTTSSKKTTTYMDVAAEFFIAPLVNRFWQFLRDEQTREDRTAHYDGRQRYHGAGTGLILNPIVLAQFLRTLSILVHASQNTPEWLAVIAPDALELAVTVGSRPVSHMETDNDEDVEGDSTDGGRAGKEASVLTAALELALIVLDGCLELDGGRILSLDYTTSLLGAGEWATGVFTRLEKGLKVEGGGGLHEVKLRRAAAGVLLKVDDLTSRWRRSMLDTR